MADRNRALPQVWKAIKQLNPERVMKEARQPFVMAPVGSSADEIKRLSSFLLGPAPTPEDEAMAGNVIRAYTEPVDQRRLAGISKADFVLLGPAVSPELRAALRNSITFNPASHETTVRVILDSASGHRLGLSLAMHLPVFRLEMARRTVRAVAQENAVFVVGTALGNVVPSVFQPVLGIAEAAGDTAFLTANQVRMLFALTAGYGRHAGYVALWKEIGSIVGAAFGWRALARNLVSKIPFGGGLIPKGAIAYAGTMAVGEGIIFWLTTGRKWTRTEMASAFKAAYAGAVEKVRALSSTLRHPEP
jgi:hypothetical protein